MHTSRNCLFTANSYFSRNSVSYNTYMAFKKHCYKTQQLSWPWCSQRISEFRSTVWEFHGWFDNDELMPKNAKWSFFDFLFLSSAVLWHVCFCLISIISSFPLFWIQPECTSLYTICWRSGEILCCGLWRPRCATQRLKVFPVGTLDLWQESWMDELLYCWLRGAEGDSLYILEICLLSCTFFSFLANTEATLSWKAKYKKITRAKHKSNNMTVLNVIVDIIGIAWRTTVLSIGKCHFN